MTYLIDTNVISEIVRNKPNVKVVDWFARVPVSALHLSVLTLVELRKGIEQVTENPKKMKLRLWLEHELPGWFGQRILSIDSLVAERWGRLQAEMHRPVPAIDSLIAATALHFDLCMVTRNTADFKYPGLEVVNPWE